MDVNGDGLLEEADFAALTERWAGVRGATPGSADHNRLTDIMMGWWRTLLATSHHGPRDTVTLDDVLAVVDRLGELRQPVAATAMTMFEAIDEDADGMISAPEYRRLIESWSGRRTDTDEVFPLLDGDGDGYLSRAEFTELWTEFWAGDDQDSPGTWVFGRFEPPATVNG
ncbi:EF-hand domain-containing protein [Actinophytocola sp. S1-96]|uniref:EF-hand domain-containing protein n=2 Tax=Actinophytocola gossypii TaxID=2812003 RepID=A0ABT2J1A9_9PSEU|nr:EF-hand domain-containing protein [Actinophytocola gossypii]